MKILTGILTLALLLPAAAFTAPTDLGQRLAKDRPADRIFMPGDPVQPSARLAPDRSPTPRRDDYIGDRFQAGDTYADYWSNGSTGKLIAVDTDDGVHVTWMDARDANLEWRHQKYNFFDPETEEWVEEDGTVVDAGTRSGYGALWLTNEDPQRALSFYHVEGVLEEIIGACGVDFDNGIGAFITGLLPRYPDYPAIWPQGVMSPEGRIHVIMNRRDAGMISYTWGVLDDNGEPLFEEDTPLEVSETHLNTYRIARSPNSEKVAMTWMNSRVGVPAPDEWDGFLAYQMNNDLWLVISEDGEDWDFDHAINVTNCIPVDPQAEDSLEAFGDTLRPYCTHDVIFDADDNVHIVFEARGMWEMPVYDPDVDRPPIEGITLDASFLFHWDSETEEITPVADGWFSQQVYDEDNPDSLIIWPTPGAWKSNVCAPSLAYDENGDLYCVFNYYPYGDYNDYVDPGAAYWNVGRVNGDIAATVSEDNGQSWYYPTLLTETRTPLAEAGDAESECYPTVAEKVDDNLHILYEMDTESGTTIQDEAATNTLCPVYYQRVPVDEVARDSIWEGPNFHVHEVESVAGGGSPWTPAGFRLAAVYPNPFNSSAAVEFEVGRAMEVTLTAVGLDGRVVAELFRGEAAAGGHRVKWNAANIPSGVYVVTLSGGGARSALKVALVR